MLLHNENPVPFHERGSDIKHYAAIHHKKYVRQPRGFEMGVVTNDIKRQAHAQLYTTSKLLEAFSNGQNILLSNFEIDLKNNIRFISSSAFAIDLDDDLKVTDPLQVLESLKDICTGLFYTFSHGLKGNRYRLLFQLDEPITVLEDMEDLIEYMTFYLKSKGLPVDGQAKSPTQIIRGGLAGYEINDYEAALKTDEWLEKSREHSKEKRKAIAERQAESAKKLKENLQNPVTFVELKEMCETIGHIPSGAGDSVTAKWLQVVYALKHYVQTGFIDNEQGYELFHIVSGGESNERYWNSIKPSGFVTIGTVIHHATQAGYKRKHSYGYALRGTTEPIENERIKVNEHIPVDVAKELLTRKQRLLVDSPTGSGKTTNFMGAFKELANEDLHFYIFAAPTRPLTEQIAKEHDVFCVVGGINKLKQSIFESVKNGNRLFVSVFDKVAELISHIESFSGLKVDFSIVIDEFHEFTSAYNYRFTVIDQLEKLSRSATTLIGLSGTCEDVLKTDFDKLITIDNGNRKSPNLDYRVFTYDTMENGTSKPENADLMLIPVIRGMLQQVRVLLFVNSVERIRRIVRLLKGEGISCQVVTSDNKQSETYTNIIENGKIDDSTQVVISTTVLSTGVSIKNELNWGCVVVCDNASPIWNPGVVKQISNRFRNQYRYFGLYMRSPNPDYKELRRFNIEAEYQHRLRTVTGYVDYLNEEYQGDALKGFIASKVERENGIFYKSSDEAANIEFNPLFIRHQSMRKKERYYAAYRTAFINEIGRMIEHKLTGIFNVNEEVRKNGSDLSGLLAKIEAEKEEKKLEAEELRENLQSYFDEQTYLAFVHEDNEMALEFFKKNAHPDHYNAAKRISKLVDYETCLKLVGAVKNRNETNKYTNDIQALTEIASFDYIKKATITKKIYKELMKITEETYTSADFKEITEKKIPKKLKVAKKDVRETLKLFHKFSSRPGGVSSVEISPLSIGLVAKIRHEIDQHIVEKSILKYISMRTPQQQKILMKSVEKLGLK